MTPLACAHHDWPSLLAAARGWSALRSQRDASDEDLSLLLQAPVALAWWISTFAPALAERGRIEVIIVCAPAGPASADDGRPYQLVPLLLDRPDLRIVVTLVMGDTGSMPVPSVPHAQPGISLRAYGGVKSAPAMVFYGGLDAWWDRCADKRPDLCLLFHPGFDDQIEFWSALRPFLAEGIPVGSFGRGPEKLARDAWLLRAYGYELTPQGVANPWAKRRPESLGHGAWAAVGWELCPVALPPPHLEIDRRSLARAHDAQQFMQHEFQVWNPLEFVGRPQTIAGDTSADPERFVGLPDHYAVSLSSGDVWAVEPDAMVPCAAGVRLPREVLATYPGPDAHSFEQLLWAVETYLHEFRPREAAQLRTLHSADVMELQVAARLHGKASASEIASITDFFGGGAVTPPTPGSEPLFKALSKRDWASVEAIVAANPRLIHAEDEDGRTPLFHAMHAQQLEIVQRWLEAGADPDHLDHEGFAPIHDAAKRDVVEPVALLDRCGADLNLETGLGFTPALLALRYGTWSVLAYLLAQKVDLKRTTMVGASVADQYEEVAALPRVLRREIERQLGRRPVIRIAAQAAAPGRYRSECREGSRG
jgi:hypothetical protein